MYQRNFVLSCLLTVASLFFTGCLPDDEPTATPTGPPLTETAVTNTVAATPFPSALPATLPSSSTPLPSLTATPFLSRTPRPSPSPRPSNTPRPTPAYLATEAALPSHDQYDMPAWVADPQTAVLLTTTYDEASGQEFMTIVNAGTGEQLNIPTVIGGSVGWTEENGTIYITFRSNRRDSPYPWNGYIEQVDITSGTVTRTFRPEFLPTRPPPTATPPYQVQRYESQMGHVVTFTDYADGWSPSATYAYLFTHGMNPSGDAGNQGACFIFWSADAFTCPLTPDILNRHFIVSVTWSPDERYWAVLYQPYSPQGDDGSGRSLGVLEIQTGLFRSFGLSRERTVFWRPAIE